MTIVAGSRKIVNPSTVVKAIARSGFTITRLVEGEAEGVDLIAKRWAIASGIPVDPFPADWKKLRPADDMGIKPLPTKGNHGWYDAAAGFRRNEMMALAEEYVDNQLIAIISANHRSSGTKDMIERAKRHYLECYIEVVDENNLTHPVVSVERITFTQGKLFSQEVRV